MIEDELRSYYSAIETSEVQEHRLIDDALRAGVKRSRPLGAIVATVVLTVAAAITLAAVILIRDRAHPASGSGQGIVTGQAPICYGRGSMTTCTRTSPSMPSRSRRAKTGRQG